MLACADSIERLLERHAIKMLAAVGEQPVEYLRDALLSLVLLQFGTIADVAVDAHGVADILRLYDQGDAVGQGADDRVQRRGRHFQALQRFLRPRWQRGGMRLAQ